MKLSDEALGAIMMALQKSLMEQSDIVPVLKAMEFVPDGPSQNELTIVNPPIVQIPKKQFKQEEAEEATD